MKKILNGLCVSMMAFIYANASASPLEEIEGLYKHAGIRLTSIPSEGVDVKICPIDNNWFESLTGVLGKLDLASVSSPLLLDLGRTLQYDVISKMSAVNWDDANYQTMRESLRHFGTECFISIFKKKEHTPEHREATMLLDYLIEEEFEDLGDNELEEEILEEHSHYSSASTSPRSEDSEVT